MRTAMAPDRSTSLPMRISSGVTPGAAAQAVLPATSVAAANHPLSLFIAFLPRWGRAKWQSRSVHLLPGNVAQQGGGPQRKLRLKGAAASAHALRQPRDEPREGIEQRDGGHHQ